MKISPIILLAITLVGIEFTSSQNGAPPTSAALMEGKKTTDRTIHLDTFVDLSPTKVFQLWTSADGVKKFFAAEGRIDARPGGCDTIIFFPSEDPEGNSHGTKGTRVLEHVPNPGAFLANIRRHLAPGGIAFVTTPNRQVFSLGHEPSPVNREHTKEFSLQEFMDLAQPLFSDVEIWGQKFERSELQDFWNEDVQRKIELLQRGERWQRKPSLRKRLFAFPIVEKAYRIPLLRKSWKYVRWKLWHDVEQKREIAKRPYSYSDFTFTKELSGALWFCAKLKV